MKALALAIFAALAFLAVLLLLAAARLGYETKHERMTRRLRELKRL